LESLYILVPIALVLVALAVKLFFWAVNSGQYEDLDTEGQRILFDDEPKACAQPVAVSDTTPAEGETQESLTQSLPQVNDSHTTAEDKSG